MQDFYTDDKINNYAPTNLATSHDFTAQNQNDFILPDMKIQGDDLGRDIPALPDPYDSFDFLSNNYPRFAPLIQKMRNSGYSDDTIEKFFAEDIEPRLNYHGNKEQINKFLGRTEESMKQVADYLSARRVHAYKNLYPEKSNDDIYNTIALSQFSGISVLSLLKYPELYKAATEGKKVSETYWESIKNAMMFDNLQGKIAKLYFDNYVLAGNFSPEVDKQIEALSKEAEKYAPPIRQHFGQEAIRGAAQMSNLILEGMQRGMPYAIAGAGMATLAGQAGPQALTPEEIVTVPTATAMGLAYGSTMNIYEREAGSFMSEIMQLKDENGDPIDRNTARAMAMLVGGINAGIEHLQVARVVEQFPGGKALLGKLDKGIAKRLLQVPVIRSKLGQLIADRVTDIGVESIQEITQEAVTMLGGEVAKAISGQPFAKLDWDYVIDRLLETGKQTAQSVGVMSLVSSGVSGLANVPSLIKGKINEIQYQKNLNEVAENLGISTSELEQTIQDTVQQNQTEINNSEENETVMPNIDEAQTAQEENIAPAVEETETQIVPETTEATKIQTSESTNAENQAEEEKPKLIFIPNEEFEKFKEENENFAEMFGVVVDNEVGLTREQFQELKENSPEFIASIANNTREGADGVTVAEAEEKIKATDPNKADIFHSENNKKIMQHVTEDFIKAGETAEHAQTLAELVGVMNTKMLNDEGVAFTPITVKNVEQDAKQFLDVLKVKNRDIDLTIKNPNESIENLRIFTFHEESENENSAYHDGDLLIEADGEIVGKLDNGKFTKTQKRQDFNIKLVYEALENISQENSEAGNVNNDNAVYKNNYPIALTDVRTENGHTLKGAEYNELIVTPDGSKNLGIIDEKTAQEINIKSNVNIQPGDIQANVGLLLNHLKDDHIKGIINSGYSDVTSFLFDILKTYEKIYEGSKNGNITSLLLTKNLGEHHGLAAIELINDEENIYHVKSLYTLREKKLNKKNLLFSRSEPLSTSPVTNETLQIVPNKTGATISTAIAKSNDGIILQNSPSYQYTDEQGNPIAFTTWKFGRAFINLVKSGNFAANVHEVGHVTFNLMYDLAKSGSLQMNDDFNIILEHAGVTFEEWEADKNSKKGGAREKAHEYFAKAFEVYLSEGKAPSSKLQKVFDRVKKFLLEIYDDITTQLGIKLDDNMRGVFDRLFTMEGGDDASSITEIVNANNRIENQIRAYEAQIRKLEEGRLLLGENSKMDNEIELDPQALQAAEEIQNYLDYEEILDEEYQTEYEYIQRFINAVKENLGAIDYQGLVHTFGEDIAKDIRATWGRLIKGRKKKDGGIGQLDTNAEVLVNAGFQEFLAIGEAFGEGHGDADLLANWLHEHTPLAKERPNKIAYPTDKKVNVNFVNAMLATVGNDETLDYLERRLKFLDSEKNVNMSEEEITTEKKEISKLQKKLNPNNKSRKKIFKRDVNQAAQTGYKIGEQEERATQKLKRQVEKKRWEQKAEERYNTLREKRQADKTKYKEKLKAERQKLREQSQSQLGREQTKNQKRIQKLQARIDTLRNNMNLRKQRQNIGKMIKRMTKMSKSQSILFAQHEEIQEYLEGFDFDRSKKGQERRDLIWSILESETEMHQDRDKMLEEYGITSEEIEELTNKIHIADMPYSEVVGMYETIKGIYERGRRNFEVWQNERQQRRVDIQQRMKPSLLKLKSPEKKTYTKKGDLVKQHTLGVIGEIGSMYWTEVQTPGRFLASIGEAFREILGDKFTELRGEAQRHINSREIFMLENMQKLGITPAKLLNDATIIDGQTYSWNNVIAIYAGMKNEKSAKAILWGNFVNNAVDQNKIYSTEEEGMTAINKILNFINQDENKVYKAVGDLILQDLNDDANFERIRQAQIEYYNKGMNKEENYTPLIRLRHQSSQGLITEELEALAANGQNIEMLNKVADNFTISRENISEQQQQPIDLNIYDNWFRAVHDQEYMAALGGYASDVVSALLMRDKDGNTIKDLIQSRLGNPYWNTLKSIFNDSITDKMTLENNALNKIMSYFAQARSIAYIPYSASSLISASSSYFTALLDGGTSHGHLFRSLADFVFMGIQGKGHEFLERVYEKSPELRHTGGSFSDNFIRQNTRNFSSQIKNQTLKKGVKTIMNISEPGYKAYSILDNWVKSVVFDAAYRSKLEEGYSDADAVRLANRVVHDTQPASTAREAPRMFRRGGAGKLFFTQFMGALAPIFNVAFVDVARNLASKDWNGIKAAAWNGLAVCLTLYYGQFAKDLLRGNLPTHEEFPNGEEDDWPKWFSETIIDNLVSSIPVFNQLSDVLQRVCGKKQFRSENRLTEPFIALYNAVNYAFNEKYDGEYNGRAIEELVRGLALIGVPIPYSGIRQFGRFFGMGE